MQNDCIRISLFSLAALSLAAGSIALISAANDYTDLRFQRDEMMSRDFVNFGFGYEYGWSSLYLIPATITSAIFAMIFNITIYANRYHNLAKRAKLRLSDLAVI